MTPLLSRTSIHSKSNRFEIINKKNKKVLWNMRMLRILLVKRTHLNLKYYENHIFII